MVNNKLYSLKDLVFKSPAAQCFFTETRMTPIENLMKISICYLKKLVKLLESENHSPVSQ
jgi:hypothetical protein